MKTELWGMFSVKDHLRKRPFVAEVLLYDRLVIPRPPTPDEEMPEPGKEDQVARWIRHKWKPNRLRELLEILQEAQLPAGGQLALELPWGEKAREDWYSLYHGKDAEQIGARRADLAESTKVQIKEAKHQSEDWAYLASGQLLEQYITGQKKHDVARRFVALTKAPEVPIEPVVAYGSYWKFQKEQSLQPSDLYTPTERLCPYAMFGWEFFVPEDTDKSDHELLRKAVKLASRPDLRETRQYFHGWLKQMHDGDVDPETARAQMLKMLQEYRSIVRGSRLKTVVRYAAKVAPAVASLAGFRSKEMGILATSAANVLGVMVERWLPKKEPDERIRPAAFVHDARRFFGKK